MLFTWITMLVHNPELGMIALLSMGTDIVRKLIGLQPYTIGGVNFLTRPLQSLFRP